MQVLIFCLFNNYLINSQTVSFIFCLNGQCQMYIYHHWRPTAPSSSQNPSIQFWPIKCVDLQSWAWCWSGQPEDSPLRRWCSNHWHCEGCSPRSKTATQMMLVSLKTPPYQGLWPSSYILLPEKAKSHFSYLPQMRITKWAFGLRIYNYHPNTWQYLKMKENIMSLCF